jgi:hypothetical protein
MNEFIKSNIFKNNLKNNLTDYLNENSYFKFERYLQKANITNNTNANITNNSTNTTQIEMGPILTFCK